MKVLLLSFLLLATGCNAFVDADAVGPEPCDGTCDELDAGTTSDEGSSDGGANATTEDASNPSDMSSDGSVDMSMCVRDDPRCGTCSAPNRFWRCDDSDGDCLAVSEESCPFGESCVNGACETCDNIPFQESQLGQRRCIDETFLGANTLGPDGCPLFWDQSCVAGLDGFCIEDTPNEGFCVVSGTSTCEASQEGAAYCRHERRALTCVGGQWVGKDCDESTVCNAGECVDRYE